MKNNPGDAVVEEVEVSGHIIDSLLLPKILDSVITRGGQFRIVEINIGQQRNDPSYARVEVSAGSREQLERILAEIADHGAVSIHAEDCQLVRRSAEPPRYM